MKTLLAVVVTFTPPPRRSHWLTRHPCLPTHAEVSYGPYKRNVLDFWQAEGHGPASLIDLHPRRRLGGRRQKTETRRDPPPWLAKGISYAAINYRLTVTDPLPGPVYDAAVPCNSCGPRPANGTSTRNAHLRPDRRHAGSLHVDVDLCFTTTWPIRNRPIRSCGNRRG